MDQREKVDASAAPSGSTASQRCARREHKPDKSKLPRALRPLPWREMDPARMWCDGDAILAAVPICDHRHEADGEWHYELAVVTIRCDEGYFAVEVEDCPWGWEIDDVDYYVLLSP